MVYLPKFGVEACKGGRGQGRLLNFTRHTEWPLLGGQEGEPVK